MVPLRTTPTRPSTRGDSCRQGLEETWEINEEDGLGGSDPRGLEIEQTMAKAAYWALQASQAEIKARDINKQEIKGESWPKGINPLLLDRLSVGAGAVLVGREGRREGSVVASSCSLGPLVTTPPPPPFTTHAPHSQRQGLGRVLTKDSESPRHTVDGHPLLPPFPSSAN